MSRKALENILWLVYGSIIYYVINRGNGFADTPKTFI